MPQINKYLGVKLRFTRNGQSGVYTVGLINKARTSYDNLYRVFHLRAKDRTQVPPTWELTWSICKLNSQFGEILREERYISGDAKYEVTPPTLRGFYAADS